MGRGGKLENKQSTKRRVRLKDKGSDESDEDYTVGDDEVCDESDAYCSSFVADESEESLGEFEEEEEEEVRMVVKPKRQKGFTGIKSKRQKGFSGKKKNGVEKTFREKRVSYDEEEEDDDDDDEEFVPDEIDCVDDEDELAVEKKHKKVGRPPLREKGFVEGRKRKRERNPKFTKKKLRKNSGLGRKSTVGSDGESTEKIPVVKGRSKKNFRPGRRRLIVHSDSDFVSSGSSDFEYTISEEEREQMREANEFCRSLPSSLRSSSSSKRIQEEDVLSQQRKRPGRKGKEKIDDLKNELGKQVCGGKEKVDDLKNELGKQVCGICLSEEGKKTVQGTLNCCSHYFCFTCIMEWSKVESRCPLCKHRFMTISKPAKSNTGFDLRTMVIQVPERDQVYQPSDEELRGYLDPYENVICTECQQGGDDALMLLCDLCDSPAHTFCVGLGREVPEGNWYCDGCRPTAIGSSTPQTPNPTPGQRMSINLSIGSSPVDNVGEGLDHTPMYVPDTPLTQGTGLFSSPWRPVGGSQAASTVSGLGAATLSDRRRLQRHIHHLRNNIMSPNSATINGISARHMGNNLFGSQIDQGREIAFLHGITSGNVALNHGLFDGRLQDNPRHLVHTRDLLPAGFSHVSGQVMQGPTSTNTDGSVNGMLRAEFPGINIGLNSRSGYDQLHPCSSRSGMGTDASVSPYMFREAPVPSRTLQGRFHTPF